MIHYHNNSVEQALIELFPEIGLNMHQFSGRGIMYFLNDVLIRFEVGWNNLETRRAYFEKYAKQNGFDPLNSDNWYLQPKIKVVTVKVFLPCSFVIYPLFLFIGANIYK